MSRLRSGRCLASATRPEAFTLPSGELFSIPRAPCCAAGAEFGCSRPEQTHSAESALTSSRLVKRPNGNGSTCARLPPAAIGIGSGLNSRFPTPGGQFGEPRWYFSDTSRVDVDSVEAEIELRSDWARSAVGISRTNRVIVSFEDRIRFFLRDRYLS